MRMRRGERVCHLKTDLPDLRRVESDGIGGKLNVADFCTLLFGKSVEIIFKPAEIGKLVDNLLGRTFDTSVRPLYVAIK